MDKIITISREFGSGGKEVCKIISKELGIPFYDRELISIAAKESGYALDFIKENGEYAKNSLLFHIAMSGAMGAGIYSNDNISATDKIYIIQSKIINDIADNGPCVIVGRCADYMLRERKNCVNLFFYSDDFEFKKQILSKSSDVDFEITKKALEKKDKNRAAHYKHYTGREWGKYTNYTAVFNTSFLGVEKTAKLVLDMLS